MEYNQCRQGQRWDNSQRREHFRVSATVVLSFPRQHLPALGSREPGPSVQESPPGLRRCRLEMRAAAVAA